MLAVLEFSNRMYCSMASRTTQSIDTSFESELSSSRSLSKCSIETVVRAVFCFCTLFFFWAIINPSGCFTLHQSKKGRNGGNLRHQWAVKSALGHFQSVQFLLRRVVFEIALVYFYMIASRPLTVKGQKEICSSISDVRQARCIAYVKLAGEVTS